MRIGAVGLEKLDVTVSAAEKFKVKLMTEHYCAEIWNINRNLFCHMTGAAFAESESPYLVMTKTTGLSLLHFSHRHRRIFFADFEKDIMTESTVVPQFLKMRIMRKRDSPDTLGLD
jgi:hypothetical protein